jgi:mannobiose 2-epimerase
MRSAESGSWRGLVMKASQLKHFAKRVRDELFGNLMPFWCGPAVDREQGGWMGWLSNDLKPDRTQPKGLILNSRILWAFSAVHQAREDALFQQMADRAFDFLMNRFWDGQYGGAFWRLDDTGRLTDDSKKIYGQAFCIYAFSEYYRAFGSRAALARAIELFELLEAHAHDARHGGYWEVRRRDWSEAAPGARLSEKDMDEKKSMNNHLHVLEAYTNLYRVWKDPRVEQRLRELLHLFEQRILDPRTHHFHHFFNEEWAVRSDSYTFGHDIEGTWLLCEAAEVLGDNPLLDHVRALVLPIARVVLAEGVAADGALLYEGKGGRIIDAGKECWPQAEAVIGFLNAGQLSGEDEFFQASVRACDFVATHLVDPAHGEWFWRINPDGKPEDRLPKVSEWKGPYHASRMCLETLHRLQTLAG